MSNDEILEKIRNDLPNFISGKRLSHTLSVEKEAMSIAKLYNFSEEDFFKVRVAALLHDITKEKSTEEQVALCKQFRYPYTNDDLMSPKVFHSITGAYLARRKYGDLIDDTIFNGIKNHTTGRVNMSLFEKTVYLADYIEETRPYGDCKRLRALFYCAETFDEKHLNDILILSYDMTLSCLISDQRYIHPTTIAARNYLIETRK